MVKKNIIAIIPARGGSKRIPNKNIIDFFGKPLIAWTIEAAVNSGIFDRVLVSTDNLEIAKISKEYGIDVPFLRDKHYDDYSTVSNATISTLNQVEEILSEKYDTVIQLMPNCPLRSSEHIIEAYHSFLERTATFQISCCKFGWMNPWWAVKLDDNYRPNPVNEDMLKIRSQDLAKLYCPTGAIWIANIDLLKSYSSFYGPNHIFFPMDWKAAVDIDDINDLEMAKVIFYMMKNDSFKSIK